MVLFYSSTIKKDTNKGKQNGILPVKGRIADLIFYTTQYGQLVRSKGTLSRRRIAHDPSFARTREQNAEFGNAVKAAKLLRDTVGILGHDIFDNRLTPRLNKVMNAIKALDDVLERGKRTVATGITHPEAVALLEGFNFNEHAKVSGILSRPFSADLVSGMLTLDDFVPARDLIQYPKGATHISLEGGVAHIDFASRKHEMLLSNSLTLVIDHTATNVVLTTAATSTVTGTMLCLVKVTFLQEVNGVKYLLKDWGFDGMVVVKVG